MNKVIIKGNICNDLEIKISGETKVLSFNVAVQRKFKNKNGEYETDFFKVSAFNQQAIFISNFFEKGNQIIIEGRLQNHSWNVEDGTKRYATDIIVEQVEFCGKKQQEEKQSDLAFESQFAGIETIDEPLPF